MENNNFKQTDEKIEPKIFGQGDKVRTSEGKVTTYVNPVFCYGFCTVKKMSELM